MAFVNKVESLLQPEEHICCSNCGNELEMGGWMLSSKPGFMMRTCYCTCSDLLCKMVRILQYRRTH